MRSLLFLLIALPLCAQDAGSSKLWEMHRKVKKMHASAAKGYLQQMNGALSTGDLEAADKALKAAIAQGTLTQTQIDEARGRIVEVESRLRAAMVAEARAKAEAEAKAAEVRSQTSSGGTSSSAAQMDTVSTPKKGPKSCSIVFEGSGLNAVRVFNVNESGREARLQTTASPGNCNYARRSEDRDKETSSMDINVIADDLGLAGTYGYEITFIEVLDRRLFDANKVGRRQTFTGTFQIPAGADSGKLQIKSFNWGDTKVDVWPFWNQAR